MQGPYIRTKGLNTIKKLWLIEERESPFQNYWESIFRVPDFLSSPGDSKTQPELITTAVESHMRNGSRGGLVLYQNKAHIHSSGTNTKSQRQCKPKAYYLKKYFPNCEIIWTIVSARDGCNIIPPVKRGSGLCLLIGFRISPSSWVDFRI